MTDKKKYPRKFVNFDPDNKDEMELFKYLEGLKFGQFSKETKEYWIKKMAGERKGIERQPHETLASYNKRVEDNNVREEQK